MFNQIKKGLRLPQDKTNTILKQIMKPNWSIHTTAFNTTLPLQNVLAAISYENECCENLQ